MSPFLDADVLTRLGPGSAGRFARDGYLALPGLLTGDGLAALGREATGLEAVARRRDFAMACMDDSPRHMTTLGGHVISETSELIPSLYRDRNLIGLVGQVAGEPVIEVEDPVERHVLNILHRAGDTHGAHTDDHPYALVLFLEAPKDPADGGLVRFLPRATSLRNLDHGHARTAHHHAGDAYLLRSDTTAHRVTPLARPGLRRTVLNFAYTTPAARPRRTPSATDLYG